MNRFFYNLSLKKRIWITCSILTVMCIAVTGWMSYYIAAKVTENNAFELSQNMLNKSVQVLDERLRHIVVSSSTIMISDPFKRMLQDSALRNPDNYYLHLSALQESFSQMKLNESSIESVLISTPIGDFYPTNAARNNKVRFKDTAMYYAIKEHGPAVWIQGHEDMLFTGHSRVVSLLLEPYTESTGSEVYMIINIKEEAIKQDLYQDFNSKGVQFMLLNEAGKEAVSISKQTAELIKDTKFRDLMADHKGGYFEYATKQSRNNKLLVNYSQLRLIENWTLVSIQVKSELLNQMSFIKWVIVLIMVGCIILAFFFSNLLSDRLLRPLYKLQGLIHKVERDQTLNVQFTSQYDDEISRVGDSFNRMLRQLTASIEELKESEQLKRQAEIKALQAQIDPHFLYNTLNTILWKSETAEKGDVREMIIALSKLFQLGLNNGREITTLDKELEHVKQYLEIKQKCYEGLFTYIIEMKDKELSNLPLVKILLQPLVENSILHGFKDMEDGGFIYISVEQAEGFLRLRVEDNGCGMDADEIYGQVTSEQGMKTSYALSNVNSRLQLFYGSEAHIEMTSTPGARTVIALYIPLLLLKD